MKLKIEIELNNDAFQGRYGADEVAGLLANIASRLPSPLKLTGQDLSITDTNGNWVGYARIMRGKDLTS